MKPSLVIVGLGNPGAQYADTRHNAGFRVVDFLAKQYGEGDPFDATQDTWAEKQKFLAAVVEGTISGKPVLLVKPSTFMNRSGECVRKVVDFFKLDPLKQLLVISDDIDLPLGEVRFRENGGPGTHNGLKSVVEQIGEGFARLRIGLGTPPVGTDLAAWVLSVPLAEERDALIHALDAVPSHIQTMVEKQ